MSQPTPPEEQRPAETPAPEETNEENTKEKKRKPGAFAADLYENTALFGLDRLVAEAFVFLAEIIRYFFRETGRTVDSQQGFRLF